MPRGRKAEGLPEGFTQERWDALDFTEQRRVKDVIRARKFRADNPERQEALRLNALARSRALSRLEKLHPQQAAQLIAQERKLLNDHPHLARKRAPNANI